MTEMSTVKKTRLGRLRRDENGAVSVEFVVWLPVLLAVGLMVADASAAFTTQATMWRTAGDLARAVATGRITPAQAEAHIASRSFSIQVTPPGNDRIVTVSLSRPYANIGTGFILSPLGTMQVHLRQYVEPHVFIQ